MKRIIAIITATAITAAMFVALLAPSPQASENAGCGLYFSWSCWGEAVYTTNQSIQNLSRIAYAARAAGQKPAGTVCFGNDLFMIGCR